MEFITNAMGGGGSGGTTKAITLRLLDWIEVDDGYSITITDSDINANMYIDIAIDRASKKENPGIELYDGGIAEGSFTLLSDNLPNTDMSGSMMFMEVENV